MKICMLTGLLALTALCVLADWPLRAAADVPSTQIKIDNSVGMKLVRIPAGQFIMGSPDSEDGRDTDEVQHLVTISKGFYMSTTPVTQGQWVAVMNTDPSKWQGDDLPVEQASWFDAVAFCRKLSQMEGKTYRLPTEAEWEYACRAGTSGQYNTGDADAAMAVAGWYADNSNGQTHSVAMKLPNAWGLFDMHGNVWQWCSDIYGDYADGPAVDPQGAKTGKRRVCRGGSWDTSAVECRSAARNDRKPDGHDAICGFRVVMEGN